MGAKRRPRLRELVKSLRGLKRPLATSLGALELLLCASENGWKEEDKKFLWVAKRYLEEASGELQELLDEIESPKLGRQRKLISS